MSLSEIKAATITFFVALYSTPTNVQRAVPVFFSTNQSSYTLPEFTVAFPSKALKPVFTLPVRSEGSTWFIVKIISEDESSAIWLLL